MKLVLGEYTVEIKASRNGKRFNRLDTMSILNHLACMAWDARDWNKRKGYEAIADSNQKDAYALGDAWRKMEEAI